MKKFVVCAITLALVMSFAGCQKQPVENGSTVSARGPMVSEGTSSVELTSQDENSDAFSMPSVPDISISQPEVSVVPKLNTSNPFGEKPESKVESITESKEESKEESKPESKEESKTESKSSTGGTSYEVADNGNYIYEGVSIDLPAGYHISSDSSGTIITVPGDYPNTNQNVTFTKSTGQMTHITKEEIDSMYKDIFDGFSGCKEFNEYTIDGYDAQYFSYDVKMSDISLNMAQLAIYLDNKAVIITFTSEVGEDFSVLKTAADSVKVL